jgi:hypothetical protein
MTSYGCMFTKWWNLSSKYMFTWTFIIFVRIKLERPWTSTFVTKYIMAWTADVSFIFPFTTSKYTYGRSQSPATLSTCPGSSLISKSAFVRAHSKIRPVKKNWPMAKAHHIYMMHGNVCPAAVTWNMCMWAISCIFTCRTEPYNWQKKTKKWSALPDV